MRNVIFRSAICVALVFTMWSCGSSSAERVKVGNANRSEDSQPAIPITVGKSEARSVAASIEATGSITAMETSDIAPKVAGKIVNVMANAGQFVSGGAVIARVDDQNARLQLATAQAGVKKAQASVLQAQARLGLGPNSSFSASAIPEVRAANANYEQAVAELKQAEANEKRYRELTESGDVAMVTYETYRTTRDTARAKANAARQQLDVAVNTAKQSNQAIASARADVASAMTQVADAQQAIADTVIRAPFSGYISSRPVAVGEYVSSASIVATILRTNPIKVLIQVPEADVPFISIGRGVSVQVDAYKDRNFGGTVSAINPAVDPASRAATVEAQIENGNNALRPGMFASAKITREGGSAGVFVPKAAVFDDRATQSMKVFVIQDGIAKLRVVQLGADEGEAVQVLSGVDADETVATSNLDKLFEGAKVAV